MGLKLTLEDAQHALTGHILEKASQITEKYGCPLNRDQLFELLKDKSFVRYPTRVEFNSSVLEKGLFGTAQRETNDPDAGYVIYIHEHFKDKQVYLPALVSYHLVTVNYGDMASHDDAELFGASVLGMEKEDYYCLICQLADHL